jgi:hypothetical protein
MKRLVWTHQDLKGTFKGKVTKSEIGDFIFCLIEDTEKEKPKIVSFESWQAAVNAGWKRK